MSESIRAIIPPPTYNFKLCGAAAGRAASLSFRNNRQLERVAALDALDMVCRGDPQRRVSVFPVLPLGGNHFELLCVAVDARDGGKLNHSGSVKYALLGITCPSAQADESAIASAS
jgi:hypothetical protein